MASDESGAVALFDSWPKGSSRTNRRSESEWTSGVQRRGCPEAPACTRRSRRGRAHDVRKRRAIRQGPETGNQRSGHGARHKATAKPCATDSFAASSATRKAVSSPREEAGFWRATRAQKPGLCTCLFDSARSQCNQPHRRELTNFTGKNLPILVTETCLRYYRSSSLA